MAYKCPHCGTELPEHAAFCPHCARDIHPRREVKKPVPLLKKLLLGLLTLAVLAAVGTGLWLALGPKAYDGYGEVLYGDYQVLLTQSVDRYVPAPEVTIPGEPEGQYRVPSRLFVNDVHTGEDAAEAFLAEVESVTAEFTGQEDSPSPFVCSEPAYNPGAPECPLLSLIDFTGESGTAELVWTFAMKNGDTITLRQTYEVTPIPVYDYYPEDHPMDTAEELQALIDSISGQVEDLAVVNLHLPPVTYEGGVTIQDWNLNLYGSTDAAGNRTPSPVRSGRWLPTAASPIFTTWTLWGTAAPASPAPPLSGPPTAPSPAGTPPCWPTAPAGPTSSTVPSGRTALGSASTAPGSTPTTPCSTTISLKATTRRYSWTTCPLT